jgi:ABC-type phosphate/phosphonate transport system substrate-binding protein
VQAAGGAAATSDATRANIAEPHSTIGFANTRPIQEQVAAATQLAERMTAVTAPEMKASNFDISNEPETATRGSTPNNASPPVNNTDVLVALIMARSDIKSVSELTGKTIAIDDRYSASNSKVRTALMAAGAPEVQLSEGQTTAINRVVKGEVPAAALALVSADAAESFPKIAGFRIFYVPLSPRTHPTGNLRDH